jgi:hypothetical protein
MIRTCWFNGALVNVAMLHTEQPREIEGAFLATRNFGSQRHQ